MMLLAECDSEPLAEHLQEIDQLREMPPADLYALVLMQMKDLSILRNEIIPSIKNQCGNLEERIIQLEQYQREQEMKTRTIVSNGIRAYHERLDAE